MLHSKVWTRRLVSGLAVAALVGCGSEDVKSSPAAVAPKAEDQKVTDIYKREKIPPDPNELRDPNCPKERIALLSIYFEADTLFNAKRWEQSIAKLEGCLALDPRYAPAYFKLAHCFYQLARYDREIEAYERCVTFAPDWLQAHLNLAHALTAQDRPEPARFHYLKVLDLNQDHPIANLNMGLIEYDFRHADVAAVYLQRFLDVTEGTTDAKLVEHRETAKHYLQRCGK